MPDGHQHGGLMILAGGNLRSSYRRPTDGPAQALLGLTLPVLPTSMLAEV